MNRISADLFPQRVNPQNFTKGDVVKKIYMDNIQTPYVGVVTAVIPSTNKVEVQWPDSTGLEEPWELIKVNPIINPPVVKEDKAYDTYQKRKNSEDYLRDLQPYTILKDYVDEHLKPILLHASDMYNEGYTKAEAFRGLTANFDNKDLIKTALNSIFNVEVDVVKTANLDIDGEDTFSKLIFKGNSDDGFRLSYILGDSKEEYTINDYKTAKENYDHLLNIFESLQIKNKYASLISKVSKKYKEQKENEV